MVFITTLTPSEKPFTFVEWKFGDQSIISTNTNATADYEGRVTLFASTGSLELRNLVLRDSGEYRVIIVPQGEPTLQGSTRLEVYGEQMFHLCLFLCGMEIMFSNRDITIFGQSSNNTESKSKCLSALSGGKHSHFFFFYLWLHPAPLMHQVRCALLTCSHSQQ